MAGVPMGGAVSVRVSELRHFHPYDGAQNLSYGLRQRGALRTRLKRTAAI